MKMGYALMLGEHKKQSATYYTELRAMTLQAEAAGWD